MKIKHSFPKWPDLVALLVLFAIALGVRLTYQQESIINKPVRADAAQYVRIAYNLHFFKVYSSTLSSDPQVPPAPDCMRPPGYPFFLYPFIASSQSTGQFLQKATTAQAFVGSLTVMLTYIIGRLCFTLCWAFMAGLFTALSPHLVAMTHFLLTETLFTFVMMLAVLVLLLSWRRRRFGLCILAGALFGYATLTRPMALLLGPLMAVVYFFQSPKRGVTMTRSILIQIACLLMAYALIYVPYVVFRNSRNAGDFSASSQTWGFFVDGASIRLKDFNQDPTLRKEAVRMWKDKAYGVKVLKQRFLASPLAYVKWYLIEKVFFMWRWDNVYTGDVYQYPMEKRGFHTHTGLLAIHTLMRVLHWPLYLLTLTAPVIFLVSWYRRTCPDQTVALLAPILGFLYFAGLLSVLYPLPRFAIPCRPFSYILAVYGLKYAVDRVRSVTRNTHIFPFEKTVSKTT